MHISECKESYDRVCIVGKGPSYPLWREVGGPYMCLNSVIETVKSRWLIQRDPGHIFDVAGPILAPPAVIEAYGRGYWYSWDDIPKRCSLVTAILLADMLGASDIVLVGADNLVGDTAYHPDFPQQVRISHQEHWLADQRRQFEALTIKHKVSVCTK